MCLITRNFINLIILIIITTACQTRGISWDPNFYIGDHQNAAIIDKNGNVVYADEPAFNGYACLSEQKVQELAEILKKARMPRDLKKNLLEKLPIIPIE